MLRVLFTGGLIAAGLAACGGGSGPSADDVFPPAHDAPPAACTAPTADGLPVLALERDGALDTFLVPGVVPTALAVDYAVAPRARVDAVHFAWDWDLIGVPAETVLSGACPASLSFADVTAGLDPALTDDVITARVVATGNDGDRREGRLTFARGTGTLVVRTEGLGAAAAGGDWWLLFEPAHGTGRVIVAPARVDRATLRVPSVPAVPGEVALVQTSALVLTANGTVQAPAGFAGRWREMVTGWYGRVLPDVPTPERVVDLETVLAPGSAPLSIRDVGVDATPLGTSGDVRLAALSVHDSHVTVSVVCPATSVALTPLGFANVAVTDAAGTRTAGPGQRLVAPVACAPGAATVDLAIDLLSVNGRRVPVRLERQVAP